MDNKSQPANSNVTVLLARASEGDAIATNELFPLVYEELRKIAADYLQQERAGHTLQPTALVNEAYLRLIGPAEMGWKNRAHFFGAAGQAIRRILVDHARSRKRLKRGGPEAERIELKSVDVQASDLDRVDMLALDEALARANSVHS